MLTNYVVLIIVGALATFKLYIKLTTRRNGSYRNLAGKTVIVTGANSGLGYITAKDFAKRGARVILACRNKVRADVAQQEIKNDTGNENVIVKLVDMASLDSIRKFAKDINDNEASLNILVNNAGAMYLGDKTTRDGLQISMQVNYFSIFLLVHLLLEKLKQSAPSRIVNVAAKAAQHSKLTNASEINKTVETFSDVSVYANAKLCTIFFTTELAKKVHGSGVTVNALHPGFVVTPFVNTFPIHLRLLYKYILRFKFLSREEGAQTSIYVAVSDKVDGVNGQFFENCQQVSLYETARNEALARDIWNKSEELVKLRTSEKIQ